MFIALIIDMFILLLISQCLAYPSIEEIHLIRDVAVEYGIDSQKLIAIASIESNFNQKAVRLNSNHTLDVGMFQVNSIHWDTTCKGIDIFSLKGNVTCAIKILLKHKKHANTDRYWLGRYHSKTPSRKIRYHNKIVLAVSKYSSVFKSSTLKLARHVENTQ